MTPEPKTYKEYVELATKIIDNRYCNPTLEYGVRRDILASILLDVYFGGYDAHIKGE